MKRFDKIGYAVVIALFALIISLPLLLFNREPNRVSVLENKTTVSFSALKELEGLKDPRLPNTLDTIITDNIGLKEEGTLAHISLMYRLFGEVEVTYQLEGKDGHIFYMTDAIRDSYQGLDEPTDKQLQSNMDSLAAVDMATQNRGIQFVFMPIPNKEAVYSEEVPDNIRVVSENSFLHMLKESLIAEGTVLTVDTEQALLNAKEDGELLYFKNHDATHWNCYGALVGYEALIETLQRKDPSIEGLSRDEIVITRETVHNPFSYLTGYSSVQRTFSRLEDVIYSVNPQNGYAGISDNTEPNGFSLAGDVQFRYLRYRNESAKNQKSILVYGDSYVHSFMMPMLSETFSDVYFLTYGLGQSEISEFMQHIKPDIVMFECVSRMVSAEHLLNLTNKLYSAVDASSVVENVLCLPSTNRVCVVGFDDATIQEERAIHLTDYPEGLSLSGWAVDSETGMGISGGVVQIGAEILPMEKIERPDIITEGDASAGFRCFISAKLLQEAETVELICVNATEDAVFAPCMLPVVP